MDKKDLNRDDILDEILRETEESARMPQNEPPVRFADREPPIRYADQIPEEPPVRFADQIPEEPPVRFADQFPDAPAMDPGAFDEEVVHQVFTEDEGVIGQINTMHGFAPQEDDDLAGESQPAFHGSPHSMPHNTGSHRKKRRSHRVLGALLMTTLILGISIGLSSLLMIYGRDVLGINSDSTTKIVTIPSGSNMEEIAQILKDNGIINRPDFFITIAGMSDKDSSIKPGDHELRPDMAYETILNELVSEPMNNAESVDVTFREGITLCDAADLLEENEVCTAEAFLDYFNNDAKFGLSYEAYLPSFQDDKFYRMEGYLFPDTYTFYKEMDVELVCQKILTNFNDKIKPTYYDRMKALNLSLDETITLASIIQAEAGSVDQMADISSVFWNRLNHSDKFPLLQSNPTSKYVEQVIKPHSMSYNEALYNSYDTYKCVGLPAGPIGNPGADAIQAALYPSSTDYYYFWANTDTKETYFARTLEEHEKNGEKIRKEQQAAEANDDNEDKDKNEDE